MAPPLLLVRTKLSLRLHWISTNRHCSGETLNHHFRLCWFAVYSPLQHHNSRFTGANQPFPMQTFCGQELHDGLYCEISDRNWCLVGLKVPVLILFVDKMTLQKSNHPINGCHAVFLRNINVHFMTNTRLNRRDPDAAIMYKMWKTIMINAALCI